MVGHVSLTTQNESWINSLVISDEYACRNADRDDVVNDILMKAKARQEQIEFIREKLSASEKSGFATLTKEEILAKSKEELRRSGEL